MPWARPRIPLFLAAWLDAAGVLVLGTLITQSYSPALVQGHHQSGGLFILVLIYCSLGWLFGSYTLLKLRQVTWTQATTRLGITCAASVASAAVVSYIFRLQISNILFFRSTLIPLFVLAGLWSGLVRWVFRSHWPTSQRPRWQIVALKGELSSLKQEWSMTQPMGALPAVMDLDPDQASTGPTIAESLALSPGVINQAGMQAFCQLAVEQGHPVHSLVEMAEQELQRIPPRWIGNQWLLFSGGIDGQRTNLQKQLKRYADVVISLLLLLITSPLLLCAMALVKLQDGGSVIYQQRRSGLLGIPFNVLKIRTMSLNSEPFGAQWAQNEDKRITPVGQWLRRTRIDELPQLINVLKGEMSLIGPRPERPDLEQILEQKIPNYRLRHWMRPGLSGWAQVNMAYASSIDDSETKLSYDLFYLRNATLWLDLLILFKTIKIILKAAGR
jgi:exopolysaccharide biosynthesis polyprenyl glycosylphosphotransferase